MNFDPSNFQAPSVDPLPSSDMNLCELSQSPGVGSPQSHRNNDLTIFPVILASKRPNTELVTEQVAVNLLSANMIQIKMGVVEYSYCVSHVTFLFLEGNVELDTLSSLCSKRTTSSHEFPTRVALTDASGDDNLVTCLSGHTS